jgi:hypothetical protein
MIADWGWLNSELGIRIETCILPKFFYGKLWLRNRAQIRSDTLDITALSEPWLFPM